MRRAWLAPGLLLVALTAAAAACDDRTRYECLDGNAQRYSFHPPGDTTAVFHWPAARMPVRVYAEPAGALPANTDSAMALWVGAFWCGELSLVRVTDSAQADVIITNPPALPPIPAGARSFGVDSVLACLGRTDVFVDTSATPDSLTGPLHSYVAPNNADAGAVAACYHFTVAHELGHAVGLLNHSPNTFDLMHAVPKRRLATPNDRFTVQLLYQATPTIVPAP